ncbi:MAG: hypothetical protein ACLUVX_04290 [Lachnospira pectinoschiza]
MIKKHLLKTILTATVVATVLMTTACGSKQTSDNTTVQQEAVKVVSNVDVKTEAEKPNEEADKPKEEAEKQPEQPAEAKEEQIEQPEENAEAVNTEAEVNAEEVNEAQNTVSEEVQEEQAEPEATPAEQPVEAPAENNNAGAVDTTPEEQPAAPAEPSPAPSPAPAPEPVVTPQEPAKPSVTEEQQLVATGKWIKYTDDYLDEGKVYTYYEYKDPITGYSMVACFCDGAFHHEQYGDENAEKAIFTAHGINDNITSFERLMKLSNS